MPIRRETSKNREKIVPSKAPDGTKPAVSKPYRLTFAALLSRVFHIDIDTCPQCGGKMRIVAALTDSASVRRYLEGTGQSAEIPEIATARAPPQLGMDYSDYDSADYDY